MPLRRRTLADGGKVYFEDGALTQFAIDPDTATRLFDNPVNGGQSQARSLPRSLVVKKGSKRCAWVSGRHTHSRIAYRQHDVGTRLHRGRLPA